jgi:sugar diacid utilization regulator
VKKILTALVVATGLLLTGCSNVDAALTLGDTKVTTAELQTTVDLILEERTKVDTSQMQLETGELLLRNQLNFQLLLTGFDEIATELDVQITSSEIATRRAEIVEQVGGAEELPRALASAAISSVDLDGYIRAILISNKLGQALVQSGVAEAEVESRVQQLLIAKLNELKVTVNPRYGKWDSTTGQIVAADAAGGVVTPSNE